jgi:hypothetical protein
VGVEFQPESAASGIFSERLETPKQPVASLFYKFEKKPE